MLSAQSWEEVVVEERLSERRGCPKLREKSRVVDSPVHEENSQGRNPGLKRVIAFAENHSIRRAPERQCVQLVHSPGCSRLKKRQLSKTSAVRLHLFHEAGEEAVETRWKSSRAPKKKLLASGFSGAR